MIRSNLKCKMLENNVNVMHIQMGFLMKVFVLLLVWSPVFPGTDANIHDSLKQWKEDLLRQLPDDQKICRAIIL